MIKYAKIINQETKQCEVGIGTNTAFYKSVGMVETDVEQAYNGSWYIAGFAPEEPPALAPTKDDIKQLRIEYRHNHIDDQTLERNRKMANSTWTQEDEAEYLALDAEVTAYIEENLPYPTEPVVEEQEEATNKE